MANYGFTDSSYWVCVGALLALFITFRLLTIFSLAMQDRKRGASENDTRNSIIQTKNRVSGVAE